VAKVWQVQEAKAAFSAVVDDAVRYGPQVITRRGKETAVVISYEEYRKLNARKKSLYTFFRNSPLRGAELDLTRDGSPLRPDIEL